jgi:hypothetical protein
MILALLFITLLLNFSALYFVIRHRIPFPFPWVWCIVFAFILLIGSFSHLGSLDRFYYFVTFISATIVTFNLQRAGKWIHWLALGSAWLITLIVLLDTFHLLPTPDVMGMQLGGLIRRPYFLEHPNVVAATLLLLPFGFWTVITIILTQSRGALFGLVPTMLIRYVPKRWRLWVLPAVAVVLLLALLVRPGTVIARVDFWQEGLRFFVARPLTGWGTGSYLSSLANPSDIMNATVNYHRTGMHTAHNALITVAAENGLLGLVPLGGLLIALIRCCWRSRHPARWGLLAFSIQQFFDDQWLHPVVSILLGCCLAVCLFYPQSNVIGVTHGSN